MQIQTKITFHLLKKMRRRGFLFCALGSIFLFIGANILSIQTLEEWGIWVFLTAIVIIYIGLKPYQELKKHHINPSSLTIRKGNLEFFRYQRTQVNLPIESIEKILFQKKKYVYGIFIQSKEKKVFFPYFTEKAYNQLLTNPHLQNIMHSNNSD